MSARLRRQRSRRPDIDGSQLKWPGAEGKFALFGEVLWIGVLTFVGGLAIITLPAAITASSRHLHRYLLAERSTLGMWGADFVRALRTGWIVGITTAVLAGILILNVALSSAQALPAWQLVLAVGVIGLAVLTVALLQSAVRWGPETGWWSAVRAGFRSLKADAGANAPVIAAVVLAVVVTWQLPPLIVPGLGCLVFAVLAVKERQRRP